VALGGKAVVEGPDTLTSPAVRAFPANPVRHGAPFSCCSTSIVRGVRGR
jgi:hypothetical protein